MMELQGFLVIMQPNAMPLDVDVIIEEVHDMHGVILVQRQNVLVEVKAP